jgi:diadenosine tetraphosphate (Ap4A) HIT family hydrolase
LSECPFCTLPVERIVDSLPTALLVWDAFPVTNGHSLVIPRRHVASWFEITAVERADLLALVDRAKGIVDEKSRPDGYTIGINDGPAAGQTVPHLHIHLIPRYSGEVNDPRGGVRWVIPEKARYWL